MNWNAEWIWLPGDPNPWNAWVAFRKEFEYSGDGKDAVLSITADTRYVVWLNGERLGQGPVRAFPWEWRYDSFTLTGRLKPGRNTLTMLVLHYGVGTFQSWPTRGGLLAQITDAGKPVIATDSTWKVTHHPSYSRTTPRITCQQAWVEWFDASKEPDGWQSSGFDDAGWSTVEVVGKPGCDPWKALLPREIPFLTEEPIYPAAVLESRIVQPPHTVWAFGLRRNFLPGYVEANSMWFCGYVATIVEVDEETPVDLYSPPGGNYAGGEVYLNGEKVLREHGTRLKYDPGFSWSLTLKPGRNLIVFDITNWYHEWACAWVLECAQPLTRHVPILEGHNFVSFGPLKNPDTEEYQKIKEARTLEDLQPYLSFAKGFVPEDIYDHTMLKIQYARPVSQLPTRSFASLYSSLEDSVTIKPNPDGDTELLLDLGKMTVGFWELEMDAPAGVIVDIAGFESLQEGHRDLVFGLNNSVRYITREGAQRFHSLVRRGGRYIILTVRFGDITQPVKIRWFRTLQNTYPCVERGNFNSSDPLLNQIWKMGQYTTRLCSEDTYVDCPTYEQTFWVGDARNEGASNHYAFGEYDLSRRCLLLAAESLKRSPLVESQVPSAWENILPTWSLLWVLACEEYWFFTGDTAFLKKIYPWVKKQNDYCLTQIRENGLLYLEGWNLLDWAPLDTPGDGACTHISAWFVMALERQIKMAQALDLNEDIPELQQAKANLIQAMNLHLWSEADQAYIESIHADGTRSGCISQQCNTIVLLAGCAPPEREAAIRRLITEAPEGVVRVGSPFFMFFTFEALARLGEYETILDLTRKHWGYMLVTGATTCWETFPGFESGGRYTRSHCHAWSAAPTYFQSRYQLGVEPLVPGFGRALISPKPAGLTWAEGRVPTPYGEIWVRWQDTSKAFLLEAKLPPEVEACIRVPVHPELVTAVEPRRAHPVPGKPLEFEARAGAQVRIEILKAQP